MSVGSAFFSKGNELLFKDATVLSNNIKVGKKI